MKFIKNKWFWIILLVVIIVVVVIVSSSGKKDTNYVTESASISDLKQTVEVTGSIESADDIDLNFTSPGTLQQLSVGVGDEVVTGQRLAALLAGGVASQVADARAALDIAKSSLDQLLAGASSEDIDVTEEEVASARASYKAALDALVSLEETRDQELANLRAEALNTLNNKYFIAQYALDVVYDAIMDTTADNDLYVSDISLLSSAKVKYNATKNDYDTGVVGTLNLAQATGEYDDILIALDALETTLEGVNNLLVTTFEVMAVTVENTVYSSTVISAFKSSINTQISAINTAITTVQGDAASLRIRNLYYATSLVASQNSVDSALASLNLAEARLNLKKAPPRDFEIVTAEANVKRAQATLNRYLSNWSETVINAPVDGVITEVNFDVGEQTSAARSVISMIGVSDMQIEVDVPESDITKVKMGDEVEITLDAFSSDEKFVGTITFIDPAATIIDGVTYYRVKASLNNDDERIKSGMTADLTISTESKENVLVVPSRAVIYREGKKYVQILENEELKEIKVTTGLRGDGGMMEILSGLSEGQEVVTFIKNGK
jgi:multidrug efflux pump subunit AcrA (membrane-fusion protein)